MRGRADQNVSPMIQNVNIARGGSPNERCLRTRCSVCGDYFQPRNFMRHVKACLRRKRDAEQKQREAFLARRTDAGAGQANAD